MAKQVPLGGIPWYALVEYATKMPSYHVTAEEVDLPEERVIDNLTVEHQLVRGRGGRMTVLYRTYRKGLLSVTDERDNSFVVLDRTSQVTPPCEQMAHVYAEGHPSSGTASLTLEAVHARLQSDLGGTKRYVVLRKRFPEAYFGIRL